jgi:glycosyltransferase involved in cell wall biosynthesis
VTSQSPLKVLFLTSSYPRTSEDSASIFLRHLAEALGKRHIEVHVLAPSGGKSGHSVEGNVKVHRFQYFPVSLQKLAYGSGIVPNLKRSPWLWLQVPFFLYSMFYSLVRLIRTEHPSLVHAQWIIPQGLVAILAKLLCGTPVITTGHGTDVFALRGKFRNALKRLVITKSNAWTANTPATARGMEPSPCASKAHIIPMGVDVECFASGNRETLRRELSKEELLVLFVGRLVEVKGCHHLLRALSLLPQMPRFRTTLWIVGTGDQRSNLERMAQDLGIEQKVRFWGAISNHRLPDFYAAADICVVPSMETSSGDTEGQCVVLLEAFASGTCLVATRVGGVSSVVTDNSTGLLVEPGNSQALAAAMEKLLSDPVLRHTLAERALVHVREKYPWARIASEFEVLYRNVLSTRSTRNSND